LPLVAVRTTERGMRMKVIEVYRVRWVKKDKHWAVDIQVISVASVWFECACAEDVER
jgi:hypothetical protein